jgi:hypothetical protein
VNWGNFAFCDPVGELRKWDADIVPLQQVFPRRMFISDLLLRRWLPGDSDKRNLPLPVPHVALVSSRQP